jgi:hypothetical protein
MIVGRGRGRRGRTEEKPFEFPAVIEVCVQLIERHFVSVHAVEKLDAATGE